MRPLWRYRLLRPDGGLRSIGRERRATSQIAQGGAISARLRAEGEKKDKANMKNEALRAAVMGITSLEEIKRVLG